MEKEFKNKSSADQGSLDSPHNLPPSSWAHSSVTTFGVRYQQPIHDMTLDESVEALVEGSDMSKLREGCVPVISRTALLIVCLVRNGA